MLPDDYYLRNFRQLVSFVGATYSGILTDAESAYSEQFLQLPEPAQRLYIRLICRTRNHFRQSRLSYPEIRPFSLAVTALEEQGFLSVNQESSPEVLLELFTREELVERFKPDLPKSARRPVLLLWILENLTDTQILDTLYEQESVLEVQHENIFSLYRLCFFGNLYQDMTEFVLRDLGLTQFESYRIDPTTLAYHSRAQLDAHVQYYRCVELLDTAEELDRETILTVWKSLPSVDSGDHHLRRRVDRMTNNLARELERLQEYSSAMTLYESSRRPPSRERRARIHVTLEQPESALELCREVLANPVNEEEREFSIQFGARTAKKLNVDWCGPVRFKPVEQRMELPPHDSVEMAVCAELACSGPCFYTENSLFNGVFGLVFWDIIFAPVSGVFFNPFQSGPADLYETEFHTQRSELITARLHELSSQSVLQNRVLKTIEEKSGIQNAFVNWRYLSIELIEMALERIPLSHWCAIFERLLLDLRNHRTGLPDLIHFPADGGYNLVEVKGPGDKLQKNQLRWMRFFTDTGIPHQVVHVSWTES